MVEDGSSNFAAGACAWQLAAGDQDYTTCDAGATNWDDRANVRYSTSNTDAVNGTSDFVWVQITIDVPADASDMARGTGEGQVWIHFESTTLT